MQILLTGIPYALPLLASCQDRTLSHPLAHCHACYISYYLARSLY